MESQDAEFAWKRIGHVDRPNRRIWEEMSAVWKARIEWIDEESLEPDDAIATNGMQNPTIESKENGRSLLSLGRAPKARRKKQTEKLVVGWGDTAWVISVSPGGAGTGKDVGERLAGGADITHM
jgi:vacuolar protein sorting-associated protein 41